MSEIKNYTVDGKDFTFYCESYGTRNGFAHKCEMFEDNRMANSGKINYLNRTWESYTFQSCMVSTVAGKIESLKDRIKSKFMLSNGYGRMTAKRQVELDKCYKENKDLVTYERLKDFLNSPKSSYQSYEDWAKNL